MGGFLFGCVFGSVWMVIITMYAVLGDEERICEREYNVYDCTRVYIPVDAGLTDKDNG